MLDRSDLLYFTLHTVMHNLAEGMILVSVILFLVSSQRSCRSHRRANRIHFLFSSPSIGSMFSHISGESFSL